MGTAVSFIVYAVISLTTVFVPATRSVQVSHQGQAVVQVVRTARSITVSVA
jgi:hypothetical protein